MHNMFIKLFTWKILEKYCFEQKKDIIILSTEKMSDEQKTHGKFKCIKLFYIYFWPGVKNRRRNTIGYLFPGERSACYSADMLLRQYKRVRRELGKKFHYRDIKKYIRQFYLKKVIVFSRVFQSTFMKKSITSAGTAKG